MSRLKTRSVIQNQKFMRERGFSKAWPLKSFPHGQRGIHSTEWLHIPALPASQPPPDLPTALASKPWRNGTQEVQSPTDSCESSFSILQTNFVLVSCNALPSGEWQFLHQKLLTSNRNQPTSNFRNNFPTWTYGNDTITVCKILPGLSRWENSLHILGT